jgi:DNA-binding beta-propeller fold protein YncE
VLALDSVALAVERRWLVGEAVRGLAVSPDGGRLYVGQPGRVLRLDSASGRELGRLTAPGLVSLRHVAQPPRR